MNETVEVDRDYLWALEVLALARRNNDTWSPDADTTVEAIRVVENANLTQPREREPPEA